MSWADTILDVQHFAEAQWSGDVIIGPNRDADFAIPALLSNAEHPLVVNQGGGYALSIEPKMRGVIQSRGELRDIKSMGQTQVPFGPEDFAKISIGDMDFYVSFTAAPPRLKRGRIVGKDPFFLKLLLTSMAMTGAILFGLSQLRVVQTLEAEQLPERLATILYQPEKYTQKKPPEPPTPKEPVKAEEKAPEPPKKAPEPKPQKTIKVDITPKKNLEPKPIPKEMDVAPPSPKKAAEAPKKAAASKGQNAAKEGEGARAKGEEGSRGSKKAAPDKMHQKKATVAGSTGGPGAGTSHSQVKQIGNVDFLKDVSGKIENILAGAGAQLGKGGARVKDFGGFDTQGNGGSALSGAGKGGGGSSDISAGLGNKGLGGGRIGTGLGAAGNGEGIVGGKARIAIRTGGPEEAVVMGAIDTDGVEAALLAHRDEFRNCYERELNAEHPTLAGRVGTTFVIGGAGRVTQAGIESTTLHNANVERCVLMVIRRIDFPVPRGGGVVQVTYPFKYSPVGK
jgi:outer membrane biosynthesis protein TonB